MYEKKKNCHRFVLFANFSYYLCEPYTTYKTFSAKKNTQANRNKKLNKKGN